MSASIFREYDIRGIFEKELNEDVVKKIGYYLAKALQKKVPNAVYMAVGYDARLHSPTLKNWLSSGINKAGLKVLDMGLGNYIKDIIRRLYLNKLTNHVFQSIDRTST